MAIKNVILSKNFTKKFTFIKLILDLLYFFDSLYEISSNIDAGAYITLPGGRRIRLGIDVRGGTTIRYPFCEDSEKNCCLKSHVNGPISYL